MGKSTRINMKKHQNITATIYDKKGRILSVGQNSYTKTHPKQAHLAAKCGHHHKVYLHAEIAALVKCKSTPYKIKIERYNRRGQPLLAKPCDICEMAIKESGIKFIEYTIG